MRKRLLHPLQVATTLVVLVVCSLLVTAPALASSSDGVGSPQSVAAGVYHTVVLKSDGSLWGWGRNDSGQLGTGDTIDRWAPARIGLGNDWQCVSAQSFGIVALKTDGSLWVWGYNGHGELGTGDTTNRLVPTRIGASMSWRSISAGAYHTLALRGDGSLWAWGRNYSGYLGTGDTANRSAPTRIGTAKDWQSIAAGVSHSLALKSDGSLWAWGYNANGALGTWDTNDRIVPTPIGWEKDWQSIAAGAFHTVALKVDGSLWAWGGNSVWQLGTGDTNDRTAPTRIGSGNDWRSISSGGAHTLGLKSDGSLWAWGSNGYGELGVGDTITRVVPTRVGLGKGRQGIATGFSHSLALKANGSLWVWGGNAYRQLGLWDAIDRSNPTLALNVNGVRVPAFYSAFTGSDRYETAIMISRRAYPTGAPAICLVKGDDFPDALAAAPLAKAYGGPVVITPSGGLTAAVTAELQRLKPKKVFFIGLPLSVRTQVEAALPGAQIVTVVGADRYNTAVLLAEELRKKIGKVTMVVLASGDKFPDALSVAPLAAKNGWAILLTPQVGPLPTVAADEMGVLGATQALVVGTHVLPAAPVGPYTKLVGSDRYDTSAQIAAYAKSMGLSFTHVALATGENYPDALVVAPYLVPDSGILLLTQPTAVPAPIRGVLVANAADIRIVDFVGLPQTIQPVVKSIVK